MLTAYKGLPEQQENEAGKGVPLVNDSFVGCVAIAAGRRAESAYGLSIQIAKL